MSDDKVDSAEPLLEKSIAGYDWFIRRLFKAIDENFGKVLLFLPMILANFTMLVMVGRFPTDIMSYIAPLGAYALMYLLVLIVASAFYGLGGYALGIWLAKARLKSASRYVKKTDAKIASNINLEKREIENYQNALADLNSADIPNKLQTFFASTIMFLYFLVIVFARVTYIVRDEKKSLFEAVIVASIWGVTPFLISFFLYFINRKRRRNTFLIISLLISMVWTAIVFKGHAFYISASFIEIGFYKANLFVTGPSQRIIRQAFSEFTNGELRETNGGLLLKNQIVVFDSDSKIVIGLRPFDQQDNTWKIKLSLESKDVTVFKKSED